MTYWNPDPHSICRDERCEIEGAHPKHLIRKVKARVHHRPSGELFEKPKPSALLEECVERAIGHIPVTVLEVQRDVKDDFGETCERTIYRHLKNLVAMGRIVKLDVGLSFAGYIKPGARMARDRAVVREYLLEHIDGGIRQYTAGGRLV